MTRDDLGAAHNTCEACGTTIPSTGGVALACGRGGTSARIQLPPPRFCTDRACVVAREQAAIERAIAAGVIDR